MRKTDQVLMWEAFEGSISQGGPLGGSSKSPSSQSSGNDSEESDAPGLMGLLAQVLQGVEDGSIDEGEACEHLSMILGGEAGEGDDSHEEQDMEDEDEDCMEDEEYGEDEEQDDDEDDAPIPKLSFPSKTKHEVRKGFNKGEPKNFKRSHNVPVRKRNTEDDQRGI